jgi:uncharacterized membrane protein YbhN (UPF0104 family)
MRRPTTPRFDRKRAVWLGVSVALLAGIVWYLPRVADFSEVWKHIRAMSPAELAILAAVAGWNLVTYWVGMVQATPGLKYRQAMVVTESATAVSNTIPGGSAISLGLTYKMMGSWGFSKSRITQSLLVSGIWNNFVKLGMPVLAVVLLAFQGHLTGSRILTGAFGIAALVAAVGVFALILRSERFAWRVGERAGRILRRPLHLLRRPPADGWGDATVKFRGRVVDVVRHSWIRLTISCLIGHLSLLVVLIVALRDVGVSNAEVSWIEILAVFAFVRLLTAVPIMPGGVGIIEIGLISGLTGAGGDHAQVVAAVLVFRLLTYVVPIVFGIVTYVFWRSNRSWLDSAPPATTFRAPAATATGPATVGASR